MQNQDPSKKGAEKEQTRAFLQEHYAISEEELTKAINKANPQLNQSFALSILRTAELSSLEAIVKYLREKRKMRYNDIGKLLDRNPRTLAVTYAQSRRKLPAPFSDKTLFEKERIPFSIFNSPLSVLEAIAHHLHQDGKTYADIARSLRLDQRTIWTVCMRADKKLSAHQNAGSVPQ